MSPAHAEDPIGLVDHYRPGSFFLATPERALLATGVQDTVTERDPDELATLVTKLLRDSDTPVAVGALPFDESAHPHIVLPGSVRWAGPPRASGEATPATPVSSGCRVDAVPAPGEYERAVARAVDTLSAGGALRKVVLARTLRLDLDEPVDTRGLLANLVRDNVSGYTYAVGLPAGGTLVGASPELLLRRTGQRVSANPIAGTLSRDVDPVQDERNAAALRASAKDLAEHQVVVEAVVEALRPFCRRLTVAAEPSLVSTPAVWHLSTSVTGELIDPGVTALRLACALHPTPAVCGTPPDLARATIAELEPFDRGFYAGAVGWCDAAGDGEWAVAIRCAEVDGSALRLYSGAGIMPASQPHLELAETSAKFRTLLRAMGLDLEMP